MYFEVEKNPLSSKVSIQVNYLGYPERFCFGKEATVENVVEDGVKRLLITYSLAAVKVFFDVF